MTWNVRHEGSPEAVELTLAELQEQLGDGVWEATDEVRAPGEAEWQAIENHPATAEIAADLEPPPARPYDDETRLDMTALIDVTLVLLVFFMLTTSVAALQKVLEAPSAEIGKIKIRLVTEKDIAENMIHVKLALEDGVPVYRIAGKALDPDALVEAFQRNVRGTKKSILLLEHTDDVPPKSVVKVIDSAKGAGMNQVQLVVPAP